MSSEMAEWFRAGYFTLSLLVKRSCDERYSQLGDLIKLWGRIPFMPGPAFPPLKVRLEVSDFILFLCFNMELRQQVNEVCCTQRDKCEFVAY
jgi:hypothetical protein